MQSQISFFANKYYGFNKWNLINLRYACLSMLMGVFLDKRLVINMRIDWNKKCKYYGETPWVTWLENCLCYNFITLES